MATRLAAALLASVLVAILLPSVAMAATIVHFADANLEAQVAFQLRKPPGTITDVDMRSLGMLMGSGKGVANLTGLEYATASGGMFLDNNQITDLSPLANLTQLGGGLWLTGNNISDVGPLANLTNLRWLELSSNRISDITPLAGLTSLQALYLTNNYLDLTPGSSAMQTIATLQSRGTYVYYTPQRTFAITPSAGPGGTVAPNTVQTVAPGSNSATFTITPDAGYHISAVLIDGVSVGPISSYRFAHVTANHTISATFSNSPVLVHFADANLEAQVAFQLGKAPGTITDVDMHSLGTLMGSGKGVANLTGLEYATASGGMFLDNNQITDLSPLANLTQLGGGLWLTGNNISDVGPLANLTNLRWLELGSNNISDITPLAGLTNLEALYLTNNCLDLTPGSSAMQTIATLQSQGTYVYYTPQQ